MQDLFVFFSFFFLFLNLFLNFKTKSILEEKSVVRQEWRRGHCFPLPLFVPIAYGWSLLGRSTYMDFWHRISSAQRVSSVITGREDKAGSRACWGRLVSMQIIQALSRTWPYPSGCPLCTKVPDPGHTVRAWALTLCVPLASSPTAATGGGCSFKAAGAQATHGDLPSSHRPWNRAHFCGRLHKAPALWLALSLCESN